MACNCKVNQKIDFITKKYGDNPPKNKETNIRGNVLAYAENVLITMALIPLFPVIFIYLICKTFTGKPIHLDKLLKKA